MIGLSTAEGLPLLIFELLVTEFQGFPGEHGYPPVPALFMCLNSILKIWLQKAIHFNTITGAYPVPAALFGRCSWVAHLQYLMKSQPVW